MSDEANQSKIRPEGVCLASEGIFPMAILSARVLSTNTSNCLFLSSCHCQISQCGSVSMADAWPEGQRLPDLLPPAQSKIG